MEYTFQQARKNNKAYVWLGVWENKVGVKFSAIEVKFCKICADGGRKSHKQIRVKKLWFTCLDI